MQISTIGIDIGKNSFPFVGFDARGGIVARRQCSRTQLVRTLANLPPCLVGMEACCGAHHLGRILIAQGHDVRLIPPQYVKPFVKANKPLARTGHAFLAQRSWRGRDAEGGTEGWSRAAEGLAKTRSNQQNVESPN